MFAKLHACRGKALAVFSSSSEGVRTVLKSMSMYNYQWDIYNKLTPLNYSVIEKWLEMDA